MVKLLLSLGAAIDSVDDRENTALMLAAKNGQTEVVRFLLSKGADKGLRDANGLTALEHAKGQGHQDIVQLLEGK
jgi:ankyrin repeat protein